MPALMRWRPGRSSATVAPVTSRLPEYVGRETLTGVSEVYAVVIIVVLLVCDSRSGDPQNVVLPVSVCASGQHKQQIREAIQKYSHELI